MSRFSPGLIFPSGAIAPSILTSFIGSQAANANASPQTFSNAGGGGFDMGAADADCWAVVALFYGSAGTRLSTGVTFGGVTCTMAARQNIVARVCEFWYCNFPGGGAGNVVATYGAANNGAVGVWKLLGGLDTANIATAVDGNNGGTFNPTLTVHKGNAAGIAISVTSSANAMTYTEPTPADFQTNETTATTYRFAGGNHPLLSGGSWSPNISVGAGPTLTGYAAAVFPPS